MKTKERKKRSSLKIKAFLSPNLSEDQKKRSSPYIEAFLSPKSREDQKKVQTSSSAHMQTIVKLLEGMQSNYFGGHIPPSPPVLAPLAIALHTIALLIAFHQGWKLMLFKSKDESISIIYTKSKESSIGDIRNKKQRLVIDGEMQTKIFILFFIRMH